MKRFMAVLLITTLVAGTAMSHPLGQGGGSQQTSDESQLSTILMVTVFVGVTALLVGDILSDNSVDSQDALAGVMESDSVETSQETGIDWGNLGGDAPGNEAPVLALGVFSVPDGRDLAHYMTGLLAPGEEINYRLHGDPVALGSIDADEAAAMAFSFIQCDYFLTADQQGFQLFQRNGEDPLWSLSPSNLDSAAVLSASAELMDILSAP